MSSTGQKGLESQRPAGTVEDDLAYEMPSVTTKRANKRKRNQHLPYRMVIAGNNYYFIKQLPNHKIKHINLGHVDEPDKTLTETYRAALREYERVFEDNPEDVSVAWFVDDWLKRQTAKYSKHRKKIYVGYCQRIKQQMGRLRVAQVRPVHIAKFIDLNYAGMPYTANAYKTLFAIMFNYAIRSGIRDTNPTQNIEPLPEPKRKRYITDEELLYLIDAAPPMIRVLIKLGAITGQRISDLLSLVWSAVSDQTVLLSIADFPEEYDEENDTSGVVIQGEEEARRFNEEKNKGLHSATTKPPGILFYPSKTRKTTGKKVAISMTDQLQETLAYARSIKTATTVYVIRKRDGEPFSYEGARSAFLRCVAKARAKYFETCAMEGRRPVEGFLQNVHFHDLKRKALTDADNQGLDAQKLGNHSTRKMTEHYLEDVDGAPQDWTTPPRMPF